MLALKRAGVAFVHGDYLGAYAPDTGAPEVAASLTLRRGGRWAAPSAPCIECSYRRCGGATARVRLSSVLMTAHSQPLVPMLSARPRILVTNDDGIDSPGLAALRAALVPLGDVTVVAPDCNRTGAARSITMRTPLWVEEVADGRRRVGLRHRRHAGRLRAAWRRSASSTGRPNSSSRASTSAAIWATTSRTRARWPPPSRASCSTLPALAVSAEGYGPGYDLSVPARVAALLVRRVIEHGFPAHTLLNVNVPDLPWDRLAGARVTTLGKRIYGDEVKLQETEGSRRRYFIYGDDLSYHHEAGHRLRGRRRGVCLDHSHPLRPDGTRRGRAIAELGSRRGSGIARVAAGL